MKKITFLLGAAMLFAGAANAQYRPLTIAAPAGVGAAPTQTAPTSATAAPAPVTRSAVGTGPYSNDSYVQQVGANQMANVTQTGVSRNVADIDQSSALGTGGNFASQTQQSTNPFGLANPQNNQANQANIQQLGTGSSAYQTQRGVDNQARIQQGAGGTANFARQTQSSAPGTDNTNSNRANIVQNTTATGTRNSATQTQTDNTGNAFASQQGSRNTSEQTQGPNGDASQASVIQTGNDNYASQNQAGGGNRAEIDQSGSRNQALQNQQGGVNRGLINQMSDDNYARQTQIQGPSNYAETRQGGLPGSTGASYSDILQNGSMNSVIVKQNAQ